jgi:hypothetical protein
MSRAIAYQTGIVVVVAMLGVVVTFAGGLHASRSVARGSVSHASVSVGGGVNRNFTRNVNVNSNVNRNVGVNRNVNVNRNVDIDRDVDIDVDRHDGGWGDGCCYHPVATAAVASAAAMTTAAVVGSMVHALPPSCEAVSVGGFTYQRCGSTWYQPQFSGSSLTYIVVNPPR